MDSLLQDARLLRHNSQCLELSEAFIQISKMTFVTRGLCLIFLLLDSTEGRWFTSVEMFEKGWATEDLFGQRGGGICKR